MSEHERIHPKKNAERPEAQGLDRRNLIKAGLGVAAGGALTGGLSPLSAITGGAAVTTADKTVSLAGGIPTRPFGKTGLEMPVLGHGGSAMAERFWGKYRMPEGATCPSMDERVAMVRNAYDVGVRYFDTARVYGESEQIMGKALGDVKDDVYIATKLAVGADQVRQSVEQSLTDLGMDSVDCMQIHSPVIERGGYDAAMAVYEQMVELREEGLFRFIGLTTHVVFEDVFKLIETGGFDQVLLARGYFPIGLSQVHSARTQEWREMCVAKAHELGMAIVTMKVFGAAVFGHSSQTLVTNFDAEKRAKLPAAAIRWVLSDPRVSMLNIGMSFPTDVVKNKEILVAGTELTSEDRALLAEFSNRAWDSEFVKELPLS